MSDDNICPSCRLFLTQHNNEQLIKCALKQLVHPDHETEAVVSEYNERITGKKLLEAETK